MGRVKRDWQDNFKGTSKGLKIWTPRELDCLRRDLLKKDMHYSKKALSETKGPRYGLQGN